MPTVPTYDGPTVSPGALPQPRAESPAMGAAPVPVREMPQAQQTPDIAGRQQQALGQALGELGQIGMAIATDMAQQANQLRVDDAANQLQEHALSLTHDKSVGYRNLMGKAALERPDGKPLAQEYGDLLSTQAKALGDGLGNDAQRDAFGRIAADLRTRLIGDATAHEAEQYHRYSLSVADGIQATAGREIGLSYQDPARTDAAVSRIQAEAYRAGQLLGKSAVEIEADVRAKTSAAHRVAIVAALEDHRPDYARTYLGHYGQQMDAADVLSVRQQIDQQTAALVGMQVGAEAAGALRPQSDFDLLHGLMIKQESGGRQSAPGGGPLTSPAGALGVGQIMPGTGPEAAQDAGLPWDLERLKTDRDYGLALSRGHLQKLIKVFGGDPAAALAAYNCGAGDPTKGRKGVRGAMREAQAAGRPGDWLSFTPDETQDYVKRIMGGFQRAKATGQTPTLEDLDRSVMTDPRIAGNPDAIAHARSEAQRQFSQYAAATKQRADEGYAAALGALAQNGWNFAALPASVREGIPADRLDDAKVYAEKMGAVPTDMALYGGLTAHPEMLANMTDAEFAGLASRVSKSDLNHLAAVRAKAINPTAQASSGPDDLNSVALKSALDERLRMLAMDPSPKDTTPEAQRVGAIRHEIDRLALIKQRESGKKMTDAEARAHVDEFFAATATGVTGRGGFLWLDQVSGPVPKATMTADQIPADHVKAIRAAYAKRGVTKPTDGQMLEWYFRANAR